MHGIPIRALMLLFLAAVALHTVYLLEVRDHPAFHTPVNDSRLYHEMATQIAAGEFASTEPYFQAPLLPYFLSIVYRIFGPSVVAARVSLCILGSLTPVLVVLLARSMGGRRSALWAGCAAAAWGPLVFFHGELLPAGLATLLGTAALVVLLQAIGRPTFIRWFVTGCLTGLAALTVSNFLLFGVLVPAGLLIVAWRSGAWRYHGGAACAFLLGVSVCVAPVTIRNWQVSGQPVLIAANGGINLYLSNNENAMQTMAIRPGLDWEYLERSAIRAGARNAMEADRYFFGETLRYVVRHPLHFVTTLCYKIRLVCHAFELPRTVNPYDARADSWVLSVLMWKLGSFAFPWGLAFPLMIPGLAACVRASRRNWVPVTFLLVYAASVSLFFVSSRHRLPVAPVVIVLAVTGAAWLWETRREWKSHRWVLVATAAVAVWVNTPATAPTDGVDLQAETHLLLGLLAAETGDVREEERHYRRAIEIDPAYAKAYAHWGTRKVEGGRINEGIDLLLQAIELDPSHAQTRSNLGLAFERAGLTDAALEQYRLAVESRPHLSLTHGNIGRLLLERGDAAGATDAFREAVRSDPLNFDACNYAAWILATHPSDSIRNGPEAVRFALAAVQGTRGGVPGYLDTLAAAYAEEGYFEQAVATAARAVELGRATGQESWAVLAQQRQMAYQSGTPYRDESLAKPPDNP